jgi:hypothetical protein
MKLPLFLMVFVNVHIHFRIWTRIRIPRVTDTVPDPAKVPDPCGSGSISGSTTLIQKEASKVCYVSATWKKIVYLYNMLLQECSPSGHV